MSDNHNPIDDVDPEIAAKREYEEVMDHQKEALEDLEEAADGWTDQGVDVPVDAQGLPILGAKPDRRSRGELDGWTSHGAMWSNPKRHMGWVRTRTDIPEREDALIVSLKRQPWDPIKWMELANFYREADDHGRAEIALMSCRLINPVDLDLRDKWLLEFQWNRDTAMTDSEMYREANIYNQGIIDACNKPMGDRIDDLQNNIFNLERDEIFRVERQPEIDVREGGDGEVI